MNSPRPLKSPDRSAQPWTPLTVEVAAATHRGLVRQNNEDHYLIVEFARSLKPIETNLDEALLERSYELSGYGMIVADGMGGMYCSFCGVAVTKGLSYCNQCGSKLNASENVEKSPGLKPGLLVPAMVATFILGMRKTAVRRSRSRGTNGQHEKLAMSRSLFLATVVCLAVAPRAMQVTEVGQAASFRAT